MLRQSTTARPPPAGDSGLLDQERFRPVAESVNDAVISADGDGRIVFWNRGAQRMFGYERHEVIGRPLTDLMPERHREAHRRGIARVAGGGDPHVIGRTVELTARRRDGSEFPIELSLGATRVDEAALYTGVIRDISDRKRAESHLAAQHAVERALVESATLEEAAPRLLAGLGQAMAWEAGGLWTLNLDNDELRCVAFWSGEPERTAEFERVTREIVLRRGVDLPGRVVASGRPEWTLNVVDEANFPRAPQAAACGLQAGVGMPIVSDAGQVLGAIDFFSSQLRAPDDDQLDMLSTISSHVGQFVRRREAEQALAGAVEELRRRARELERSNDELEQFAYIASHDLSEPLRMVSGFGRLLADRYRGQLDDQADEFIHYMLDGARRMQALIDDLLAFSRVGRDVSPDDVGDAGAALEAVRAALATTIEERGGQVEADRLPPVGASPRELEQLLQNLLSNAIKFCEDAPRVRVSAAPADPGWWHFEVADNGIGIEPRHAERVFKMFQRLQPREAFEGTGIGLAICKKIVEGRGGRIWLEPGPAGGTAVHFTLPGAEGGPPA